MVATLAPDSMVPSADARPDVLPTDRLTASGMPVPQVREELRRIPNGRNVLNVVFEGAREVRFVASPNHPMRQIWLSAMARSYKLSWSEGERAFMLGGENLSQLLDRLVRDVLRGRR